MDEIEQEDGRYRVLTTYKVIHKKVPCIVANRKNWKKFGASALDGPGPNVKTTYVAEEVPIQFVMNQAGESQEQHKEEKKIDQLKGYASRGHCRICKADDHWSVTCPYKVIFVMILYLISNKIFRSIFAYFVLFPSETILYRKTP